jgi:hypothetical protein
MYCFQYNVKWKTNSKGFIFKKGDTFGGYKSEWRNGYFESQIVLNELIDEWNINHSYTGYYYAVTGENKAQNAKQKTIAYEASEVGKGAIGWIGTRNYIYIKIIKN